MKKGIIITADDFGMTRGINKAIFEVIDTGVLTSTSVMTNIPFYTEIMSVKDKVGIGVHFNLTEGQPVLRPDKIPTLVNSSGEFYDYQILIRKAIYGKLSRIEVWNELEAQLFRLIEMGIHPAHMDSHESIMKYPFFIPICRNLAKKYSIRGVRTYRPRQFDYARLLKPKRLLIHFFLQYLKSRWFKEGFIVTDRIDSLIRVGLTYDEAIEKLRKIFRGLQNGVLEIIVHPGYSDKNIRLLGGYIIEREIELKALLSEELKEMIRKSGAELINYNDI